MTQPAESVLNLPAISGRYLFPQPRRVREPFRVSVPGAELLCYRQFVDSDAWTLVHFHGNGEAVADYVPWFPDAVAEMGLNSLLVEYRAYGGSSGRAELVSMLDDGEAALEAAGIVPEKAIAFGRSIGSLYAIELAHRQPTLAGLILESGIADPSERFLTYADLKGTNISYDDVVAEAHRHFNHETKLGGYANPLLILHTENDGLVDISHAQRNHDWAASQQKRIVRFRLGNHNTILQANEEQYREAVEEFVRLVTAR
jgi:pimeloyl-ACP methyl ester carboxylesterase